jgi:Sulfotransferase family
VRNAVAGGLPRAKVLSVIGPGRSGTTVLGRALGEVDGVIFAGELRWLWRRGIIEGRPCGCGQPPVRCPVWARVLADVLGAGPYVRDGVAAPAVRQAVHDQLEVAARRNRLRVLTSAEETLGWPAFDRLRAISGRVVTALATATGAVMVVDTSKRAQEAAVLAAYGDVDQYVLHIVRDPRAVAWSWGRAKPLPSAHGDAAMARRTPASSAIRWMENSVSAHLMQRRLPASRWLEVRYEDFVTNPRGITQTIIDFADLGAAAPVDEHGAVHLGSSHTVAGNPNRFHVGLVQIRPDNEWQELMPARQRRVVEALTAPFLRRYGYPLVSRAASRGSGV